MEYREQIIERIVSFPDGIVFSAQDFLDITGYETVRSTLNRLVNRGSLTRVLKGLYFKHRYNDEYRKPTIEAIAAGLARKYRWTIAPSGATALKYFGLTDAAPTTWTFLSDGPYTSVVYESTTIEFKHRRIGDIRGKSEITLLLIQALKALGKDNVGPRELYLLQKHLDGYDTDKIVDEAKTTSKWIYRIICNLCEATQSEAGQTEVRNF